VLGAPEPLGQHRTAGVDDDEPSRLGRPDAPHIDGHAAHDTVPDEQRLCARPLEGIGHAGRAWGRGDLGARVGVVPRAGGTRRLTLGFGALAGRGEEIVGGGELAEVDGAGVGCAEPGFGQGLVRPFRGTGRRGHCRRLVVRRAPLLRRLARVRGGVGAAERDRGVVGQAVVGRGSDQPRHHDSDQQHRGRGRP
jgi:hypothetical protein